MYTVQKIRDIRMDRQQSNSNRVLAVPFSKEDQLSPVIPSNMYSCQQYQLSESTNCVKVSGNNFTEIPGSDYWTYNAAFSQNQVSQTQALPQTSHLGQEINHHFNQHLTNGNSILPNNNQSNGTQVHQESPQIQAYLNSGNKKSILSDFDHSNTLSDVGQQQITQYPQYSENYITPNDNMLNQTQVSQSLPQAESYLNCTSQKLPPSSSIYPSHSSYLQQQQISQFHQYNVNGNSNLLNRNERNEIQGCQWSPQTKAYLNSGESSLIPDIDHTSVQQQQIDQYYQATSNGKFILPNNKLLNGTQVNQECRAPTQFIQRSYQMNGPSNMAAYTTPDQSNRVVSRNYQYNQPSNMSRKSHMAHISIVKTPGGAFRTDIKKVKRKRTMFTTDQVTILENIFFKKAYINREERLALADQLHINEKTVKVWFQNRRVKDKRLFAELEEEIYSPDSSNAAIMDEISCKRRFDHLSCGESLITQTNKDVCLTINDKAVNSIAADIFNDNTHIQLSDVKNNQEQTEVCTSKLSTMYEPISPAATESSHIVEPFNTEDLLKPEETLQQLLDLQSILNSDYSS